MSKIVLVGHSAAGKSSVHFKLLESGIIAVEMDKELGVKKSPSLAHAINWMRNSPAQVLTLGVHSNLINELAQEKGRLGWSELLKDLTFIYLFHDKDKIEWSLSQLTPRGKFRPPDHVESVMKSYRHLNPYFQKIADHVIDSTIRTIDDVAQEVIDYARM
jgi:hypothetical protein